MEKKETKAEYYARTTKSFKIQFRKREDADVIEKMQSVSAKTDYVRKLIRKDIESEKNRWQFFQGQRWGGALFFLFEKKKV